MQLISISIFTMQLESNIINFVKYTLIQMSCNNKLEHVNQYTNRKYDPLLNDLFNKSSNLDTAIEESVKKLLTEAQFNDLYNKIIKSNSTNMDEDYDDYDEYLYDLKSSLFVIIVNFIGLYAIYNLDENGIEQIKDKLFADIFV
jgi:hypothetical protein